MTTLANLRAKLNGEIGVVTDAETEPWSTTVRDNAIIDGYAALWRAGVWKDAIETFATTNARLYALSTIQRLDRLELLDSDARQIGMPRGNIETDGAGGYQVRLVAPVSEGESLVVRGWLPFKSQFSGDGDTDDLPAEHNRVPLLKAKAILWRIALGKFARYGVRQSIAPEMNMSIDQLIGMIAAAEREFAEEARALSNLRPRSGQNRKL